MMQEQNSPAATTQTPEEVKSAAKSFAELRSIAEASKKENVHLTQRISQLEEQLKQTAQKPADDEDSGAPYVDSSTLRKKMDKFESSIDQKIEKKAEEKARLLIAEERRRDYLEKNKDFNEIMQQDEIQKFVSDYPHIASGLEQMPDNFERQKLIYETIKTFKGLKPVQSAPLVPKSHLAQAFDARKSQMAYQPGGSSGGPFASIGDFSQNGMKTAYDRFKSLQKTVNL